MTSGQRQVLAKLDQAFAQGPIPLPTTSDDDVGIVESELCEMAGGRANLMRLCGQAIRKSFDQVYDGQHTGRFHADQLSKTEKTNTGSLVEIWLARQLNLPDGDALDFCIAGFDVDCKFSFRDGGWMLPPEIIGGIAMLVTADDYAGTWSLGLLRITAERTRQSRNRDAKTSLDARGRDAIRWVFRNAQLPENVLLRLPAQDALAIMQAHRPGQRSTGQQRLDELFRRSTGRRISRSAIATVAQQDDFMKRVRSNGGSRTRLAKEGYLLLGHYSNHRDVAAALHVPEPEAGEIVSVRVTPCDDRCAQQQTNRLAHRSVDIGGRRWHVWAPGDIVVTTPDLAHH